MAHQQMFNWASFAFALTAAVLWWVSATRRISSVRNSLDDHIADTNKAIDALRAQSRWNAWAASAAAIAAMLQAASLYST
jgi:hypothetical protein